MRRPRPSARRGVVATTAAVLAVLATPAIGRVDAADDGCPPGSRGDPARAARLVAMAAAEGASRRAPDVCFTTEVVEAGGLLVLGASRPWALLPTASRDAPLAARLAHLALHVEKPPFELPSDPQPVACAQALARAAVREAEATLLEERLLARFGGEGSPSPVEATVALRGYLALCRAR